MSATGKTAIVVGGGVGGLAAAIHLARAGLRVRLLERHERVGGKLREVQVGGQIFPGGPSVFTMKGVFDELFGGRLEDHLTLQAIDPLCRHFFADGSVLDLYADTERSRDAIERFAGRADARGYLAYRQRANKIHEIVRGPFMESPVPGLMDFLSPKLLFQMLQIDGMRTMQKAIEEHFADPRLRQLFGRYATYNGSSPYHAPATLAVIMHVENAYGIWSCKGGIYRLAEALLAQATALGVEITTGVTVDEIVTERERAVGVRLAGVTTIERADLVIANCDVAHLYERLLPSVRPMQKAADKYHDEELSLSAFVLLAVAKRAPLDLLHHNVFFSADYRREFDELVDRRRPPTDPTVYLCADDRQTGDAPADLDRCFLLTNAPPRDARGGRLDWAVEGKRARDRIVDTLARHRWPIEIVAEQTITPEDHAARFPGSRGALYGLASNSRLAAFKRPPNTVPGIRGLYLAGGTVHPGAGLPMVCLSARIATRLALEEIHARN